MIKNKQLFYLGVAFAHFSVASGAQSIFNFKELFLGETRKCDPTWLECTKLKRHTSHIEKVVTLKTDGGNTLIASGGHDNLVCMWDFDVSGKQQPLEYNINSRGVVRNLCLTQINDLIYLFWVSDEKTEAWNENGQLHVTNKYYVQARIYGLYQGAIFRTTFNDLEFGPYDKHISCIEALQPNIIIWYAGNMRYELDITSGNPPSAHEATNLNGEVCEICILDHNNIAELIQHKSSPREYPDYFIQINNDQNNRPRLLHNFKKDYPGMCVCKDGTLLTTTKNGFISWNWKENKKLETHTSSDEYLFENCKQYTDKTIMSLPSCCKKRGIFVINVDDGEIVQHYTSEQLLDIASSPSNLSITDELIVYTVHDYRHPDHKMFDDVVYVIKRPQV